MAPVSNHGPRYLRFVPAALFVGGMLWNELDTVDYWGDPLMAAACVTAGALLSLPVTIAFGVATVLGVLALTVQDGSWGTTAGYLELLNTALAALIGVWVNRVIARHGRRLDAVRSVAEAAQSAVLPPPPSAVGPLVVAAGYQAAGTEARIGGDAYAVQRTPYGTRVLIADVRGKGLRAVRAVSVLLGSFRELAVRAEDLTALADGLERSLMREVVDSDQSDEEVRAEGFITALIGELDPGGGTLRLVNCGHPAAYLLNGGQVRTLTPAEPGLPLGMGALGGPRPQPDTWPLTAGDTLLLITDGVTEARDAGGEFYDPAKRLPDLGPLHGPQQVVDSVFADVARWTGGPRDDDMAVLAVTYPADATDVRTG
ncbi:PP2C family protein-serine/threonine phosphatase [Kitasatospora sp. NBC_01539]|uniref:PP2C family protein-serine/threonine phosphatase n=1 Tax=Kitasatospora sp. NBC_01539 TaxID=2903577 RepID=UPI003860120E